MFMLSGIVSFLQIKFQSDLQWFVCRSDEVLVLGSLGIRQCLSYFIVFQFCKRLRRNLVTQDYLFLVDFFKLEMVRRVFIFFQVVYVMFMVVVLFCFEIYGVYLGRQV